MNGHHPDYETLIHNVAGHPAPLAHLPPHAGGPPPHPGSLPQHAIVPAHEVHQLLQHVNGQLAQIQDHQRRQPPPIHQAHGPQYAPHPDARHIDHYEARDREERREREERRDRRHDEDYVQRRDRQRPLGTVKHRDFPVGFEQLQIAPGASAEIEVKPQVTFQGRRLAIAASLARYFDVLDIKVGKDSQLAATGNMGAECFSSLAVDVKMELDVAEPGIVITLLVQNVDTAPQDFKAVLYGVVYET